MSGDHSHGHDHHADTSIACAVLHRDAEGNRTPCPGYPHSGGEQVNADALAEARRVLDEHTKTRMQACADEVEQVLKRHGFRLEVTPASIVLASE